MSKLGISALLGGIAAAALSASSAQAVVYGGIDFPQGAISFADVVVNYTPGVPSADAPYQGADNALGVPDFVGGDSCASQAECSYVSLGVGGTLVVQFTDNFLTGSGTTADDLFIFEIGPDVEDTTVEVSSNGSDWFSVGSVTGSTRGIDLDAFGFGTGSSFSFVRLIDVAAEGEQFGTTVGADIDAVGAISTRVAAIPEPATWAMMIAGFGMAGATLRRRRTAVAAV